MSKIIRVVTTITLDVDAMAWAEAYGLDASKSAEIRADVKECIRQNVTEHFRDMGLLDTYGAVSA